VWLAQDTASGRYFPQPSRRPYHVIFISHEEYQGLRVTPNLYNTLEEVDIFAEEMEAVVAKGLPA